MNAMDKYLAISNNLISYQMNDEHKKSYIYHRTDITVL